MIKASRWRWRMTGWTTAAGLVLAGLSAACLRADEPAVAAKVWTRHPAPVEAPLHRVFFLDDLSAR